MEEKLQQAAANFGRVEEIHTSMSIGLFTGQAGQPFTERPSIAMLKLSTCFWHKLEGLSFEASLFSEFSTQKTKQKQKVLLPSFNLI